MNRARFKIKFQTYSIFEYITSTEDVSVVTNDKLTGLDLSMATKYGITATEEAKIYVYIYLIWTLQKHIS